MFRQVLLTTVFLGLASGATWAQAADDSASVKEEAQVQSEATAGAATTGATTGADSGAALETDSAESDEPVAAEADPDAAHDPAAAEAELETEAETGAETTMATDAGAAGEEKVIAEQDTQQTLSRELIGMPVMHAEDGKIGEIEDLLFDEQDQIAAGVVSVGGFLGLGAKSVALSWESFRIDEAENVAYLDMTKEQLEQAPSFKDKRAAEAEEAMLEEQAARQQQLDQTMQQQPDMTTTAPGAPE